MSSWPFSGPIACEPLLMLICCSSRAGAPNANVRAVMDGGETNSAAPTGGNRRLAHAHAAVIGWEPAVHEHGEAALFELGDDHVGEPGVLEHAAAEGDGVEAVRRRRVGGRPGDAAAEAGVEAGGDLG